MDNMFFDIDINNLPKHIAIIMDGNGRWAKKRFLPRTAGHKAGVVTVRKVITECKRLGIKHVTLYTFSTENWKRPALEVETLMTLLQSYLKKEVEELNINNVKLTAIGDIEKLPKSCLDELKRAMELRRISMPSSKKWGRNSGLISSSLSPRQRKICPLSSQNSIISVQIE